MVQKGAKRLGLAMCSSGRRPDQGGFAAAGPSEQRAAKRSADDRREAEAPKQHKKSPILSVLGFSLFEAQFTFLISEVFEIFLQFNFIDKEDISGFGALVGAHNIGMF